MANAKKAITNELVVLNRALKAVERGAYLKLDGFLKIERADTIIPINSYEAIRRLTKKLNPHLGRLTNWKFSPYLIIHEGQPVLPLVPDDDGDWDRFPRKELGELAQGISARGLVLAVETGHAEPGPNVEQAKLTIASGGIPEAVLTEIVQDLARSKSKNEIQLGFPVEHGFERPELQELSALRTAQVRAEPRLQCATFEDCEVVGIDTVRSALLLSGDRLLKLRRDDKVANYGLHTMVTKKVVRCGTATFQVWAVLDEEQAATGAPAE